MSFSQKLSQKAAALREDYRHDCCFSRRVAGYRLLENCSRTLRASRPALFFCQKKDREILAYLKQRMEKPLARYQNASLPQHPEEQGPIWICWWTGLDTAPALVQSCVRSILKNAGGRTVHYISRDTVSDYMQIPGVILRKAENGQMKLAHLADYIRVSLLDRYGGLWLDTTIFCSGAIPDDYFELPFFTCKSPAVACRFVSSYRWTTFCLGGWKNNPLFGFLTAAFEAYWQQEDAPIDYLLFDYLICLAYEEIPVIRDMIDRVPVNNLARDQIQAAMNQALPAEEFNSLLAPDTVLYKLSWRETYRETASDGRPSVYSYFLTLGAGEE